MVSSFFPKTHTDSERTFIIAEAGVNHNGSLDNAKKLIQMAKRCGADAIKFQKKNIDSDIQVVKLDSNSEGWALPFGKNLLEHQDFLEFSKDKFKELKNYADKLGILFLASAWDEESADYLIKIGVPIIKIGSPDLTNFPLLEHVSKKGVPIILSTGMADLETVREAYEIISMNNDKIAILQCTSSYPTLCKDINLNVIKKYQQEFTKCVIGYSGHEQGVTASLGAVALGAKIIERHITINKNMPGIEHIASLEEEEFSKLVRDIRVMEMCLGSHDKKRLPCELDNFQTQTKSLIINKDMKEGDIIKRENITTKIGGYGISPTKIYYTIGKSLVIDLNKGSYLKEAYLM